MGYCISAHHHHKDLYCICLITHSNKRLKSSPSDRSIREENKTLEEGGLFSSCCLFNQASLHHNKVITQYLYMSYLISPMNFTGAEMQMQHCLPCQIATVSHTELVNLIQAGSTQWTGRCLNTGSSPSTENPLRGKLIMLRSRYSQW